MNDKDIRFATLEEVASMVSDESKQKICIRFVSAVQRGYEVCVFVPRAEDTPSCSSSTTIESTETVDHKRPQISASAWSPEPNIAVPKPPTGKQKSPLQTQFATDEVSRSVPSVKLPAAQRAKQPFPTIQVFEKPGAESHSKNAVVT